MNLDQDPRPGTMPAAVAVLAALVCAVILAGLVLARCSAPTVPPAKVTDSLPLTPTPAAIASSSAAATASQAVKVAIRRPVGYDGSLNAPGASPAVKTTGQETPGGFAFEEIVIEVAQDTTAAASSEASASVDHFRDAAEMVPQHARLGVIAATMPGILAADYQLLQLDASPLSRPILGVDLELGLDVAGNAQVGALGLTAGRKAFAGGYAWSRWDLGGQGLAGGVGLRF